MRQIFAAREKERELEDRYLTMLDATPLSCMLWDKDARIIDCNAEAVRLYEAPSKTHLLANFFDFSPEYQEDGQSSREKARRLIEDACRTGGGQFEWIHRTGAGVLFPTEITLVRVRWREDFRVAAYARDLRQFKARLKEIEETQHYLIAARERAEKSARAKNEFLANVSHELRTPMNAVIGMTQLLLRADMTDKQRFYVGNIDKSAKHLLRTINDILDFAKIDAGKMTFENAEFSLQKLLGDLLDSVMQSVEDKRLGMALQVDPAIPDTLRGDSFRITQVLLNLFSNAVKFTRKGEIRLDIRLEGPPPPPAERAVLRFSLSDTGIGLSEEQIQGLFKPFCQADSSITRKYGGTGLGLAICKNIVTLMGGAISCTSAPGKGTSFTFTVSFDTAPRQKPPAYHKARGKTMFALIDQQAAFTTMQAHCRLFGCSLQTSVERDGWDIPEGADFILVSRSDIRSQTKRIREKIERITKLPRPGVIIAVSSKEDQSFVNSLDQSFYILYKPVTINAFYGHIEEVLDKKAEAAEGRNPAEAAVSDESRVSEAVRGARVLLVEDNEINQLMASELLIMGGLHVDIACNGREAVEMVGKNNYDIVLMDIQMPEMDGLTATRIIRESANTIPILALTAHALAIDREKSLEAGMNDHITKPIDQSTLFTALARWLRPAAAGGGLF
jgi:two-component system sensor histidine kinase/response regulator